MSKFQTFCKIVDYIDQKSPRLSNIVNHTCLDRVLSSKSVTFLMPDESTKEGKEFVDEVEKLVMSDDSTKVEQGVDMLNALILRGAFLSTDDFDKSKDNIPNSLYPYQHVSIDSTDRSKKTVTFKNGATATPATDFKVQTSPDRPQKIMVWKLKGRIPVTKDQPAKFDKKKKPAKKGSYQVTDDDMTQRKERLQLAAKVEKMYIMMLQMARTVETEFRSPIRAAAACLLDFLHREHNDIFEKAMPLMCECELDFYILVQPDACLSEDEYLVPTSVLRDWPVCEKTFTHSLDIYNQYKSAAPDVSGIIKETLNKIQANPRGACDEITNLYNQLESTGSVNGVPIITNKATIEYLSQNRGLKLIYDELWFIVSAKFCPEKLKTIADVDCILNIITECTYAGDEEHRRKSNVIIKKSSNKYNIAPHEIVEIAAKFVNSCCFLHVQGQRRTFKHESVELNFSNNAAYVPYR